MIADWRPETALKYLIYLVILVIWIALSGCAGRGQGPTLDQPPDFIARGKIALRTPSGNHTANFAWQQYGEVYRVDVWGVLGQGRLQLVGTPSRMEVRRGRERVAVGDPDSLMKTHLGWQLPVAFLPGWMLGEGVSVLSPTAKVANWTVEFSDFRLVEDPDSVSISAETPRRLDARNGPVRLIVLIGEFVQ